MHLSPEMSERPTQVQTQYLYLIIVGAPHADYATEVRMINSVDQTKTFSASCQQTLIIRFVFLKLLDF